MSHNIWVQTHSCFQECGQSQLVVLLSLPVVTPEDLRKVPRGSTTVSRKQASIALPSLLHNFHGDKERGAVDRRHHSGLGL